jgi:hypothetical protein
MSHSLVHQMSQQMTLLATDRRSMKSRLSDCRVLILVLKLPMNCLVEAQSIRKVKVVSRVDYLYGNCERERPGSLRSKVDELESAT